MQRKGEGDARAWAKVMHTGQSRIGGGNYFDDHLTTVARLVKAAGGDDEQVQIAWLHDIVEDTDCNLWHLRNAGFSERVVEGVKALSRGITHGGAVVNRLGYPNPESRADYIARCMQNEDARLVKRADLIHNFHDDRTRTGMWKRYERDLRVIAPDIFEQEDA